MRVREFFHKPQDVSSKANGTTNELEQSTESAVQRPKLNWAVRSILHDDGIAATSSELNTKDCQFPDAILQLIHFILDDKVFTFDNLFFIQIHEAAMGPNLHS
eukprot:g31044.t1